MSLARFVVMVFRFIRRRKRSLIATILSLVVLFINVFHSTFHEKHLHFLPTSTGPHVNIDIWRKVCSYSINSLRQFPFFPSLPTERKYLFVQNSLAYDLHDQESFSAMRIMGYLHPPKTGYYVFHIISSVQAQFWLSNTTEPVNTTKIAYTTLDFKSNLNAANDTIISKKIFLNRGSKRYFEILLVLGDNVRLKSRVVIHWLLPDASYFTNIPGNQLSNYFNVSSTETPVATIFEDILVPSLRFSEEEDIYLGKLYPLDNKRTAYSKKPIFTLKQPHIKEILGDQLDSNQSTEYTRETVGIVVPYMDRSQNDVIDAFLKCVYEPAYIKNRKVERNNGVYYSFFVEVFPSDFTNLIRCNPHVKHPKYDAYNRCEANQVIEEEEVLELVKSFMDTIIGTLGRIYQLHSIINIEKYSPPVQHEGDKYLIDVVLRRRDDGKLRRFAEYFYRTLGQTRLCFLRNMRWKSNVLVNVIINVRNQAKWFIYFVQEMATILRETRDNQVHFIVVDYDNEGIDMGKEMRRNGIKRFSIIKRTGTFHKSSTINMAAELVEDPNSIVFLTDLHFKMPLNLFDAIRKHTIQGKTTFAPQVMRLDFCSRPRTKYIYSQGYYEPMGFGVFGIYKSDWDKFGGMNEVEFKNKWGGEDWEMVDRIINKGYEIEKLRLPGFYHFYHDRKGMWNQ